MIRKDPTRLDTGESAIFKRQIEHVKSKTYDTKYKQLKAALLFPVSAEAPNGAESITFRSFSKIGVAKVVSDYANDFPRVDVFGAEKTVKPRSLGDAYGYSIEEIRRSQMANANLDQRRANAARRAIDELINSIAFSGDSDYDLQGFIDYPGITEYTIINDGTGTTKTWSTKTPDQIVRDITGLTTAVIDVTNGREVPTDLLVPIIQYQRLKNTRMTDGNDKTIMTYLLDNNIINSIDWVTELKTAGSGSTARAMVYVKDPDNITLEIPQAFEQFPAQAKGMEFEIPCHAKTAGIIMYYPLSAAYGDGI